MISVLWLSVRFLALYAVLLAAFAVWPLQHLAGDLVAAMAAGVLRLCLDRPVAWALNETSIALTVPMVGDNAGGQTQVNILEHIRNLPLFFAIVFAGAMTHPALRRRRLVVLLAAGSLGLLGLDSMIVAGEAWQTLPDSVPFNRAYEVLAVVSIYHATGAAGLFAAPVFIGALAALAARAAPTRGPTRAAPNAPCPCGSGRKWKRCCGNPAETPGARHSVGGSA